MNKRRSRSVPFSAAIGSNLVRKVAFSVFVALIIIEIVVLIPSYMKKEEDLLARQAQLAEVAVMTLFRNSSLPSGLTSFEPMKQSIALDNILGLEVQQNNRVVISTGNTGVFSSEMPQMNDRKSQYNRVNQSLNIRWKLIPVGGGSRIITLHLDVAHINTELTEYLARIAGLVIIISSFVTLSTMAVLWLLVLSPIIQLDQRLKSFTNLSDKFDRTPLTDRTDEIGGLFREFDNMRKRILEAAQEIGRLAITDQLTGLNNRRKLDAAMGQEIERFKRYRKPLSIIMCDLDHFKKVNDTFGHKTGDDVIVALSEIIKNNIRGSDILGRWGGEEFMIICPDTNLEGAHTLAEKIRIEIGSATIAQVGSSTASFGIAEHILNESCETFLSRADKALYKAKFEGRNQVRDAA